MADLDLRALLESWAIHLRAERKSEGTVRLYTTGVRVFLSWCSQQGQPATLDWANVAAFIGTRFDPTTPLRNARLGERSPAHRRATSRRREACDDGLVAELTRQAGGRATTPRSPAHVAS